MKKKILRKLFKKGNTSNVDDAGSTPSAGMYLQVCGVSNKHWIA